MGAARWLGIAVGMIALHLPAAVAAQQDRPDSLVVISPGGQLPETLKKAAAPFEKERNIRVQWVSAGSATEIVAKVAATKAAPDYDVAFLDDASLSAGTAQSLWAPLDEAAMPNVRNLVPAALPASRDGVAYGLFFGALFYRTDEFKKNGWPEPTSWMDLLKREYCGRVGMYHPNISYGLHMLIMMSGGDLKRINEGIGKVAAFRDCIPVLDTSAAKYEEKIQLGEIVIGNIANIRGIPLARRGLPIRFVIPKEGVVVASATVTAIRNEGKPARVRLAQEFVNWMIGPFAQDVLMNSMYFAPSNATVAVPPELTEAGILDAERLKAMVTVPIDAVVQSRREVARAVDRAMAR